MVNSGQIVDDESLTANEAMAANGPAGAAILAAGVGWFCAWGTGGGG